MDWNCPSAQSNVNVFMFSLKIQDDCSCKPRPRWMVDTVIPSIRHGLESSLGVVRFRGFNDVRMVGGGHTGRYRPKNCFDRLEPGEVDHASVWKQLA